MDEQSRWNARYTHSDHRAIAPIALLNTFASVLPHQGHALDVACGLGANAKFLAKQGLSVDAVDISDVALNTLAASARAQHLAIQTFCLDLEHNPFPQQHYDVIVVSNYLQRSLFPILCTSLRPQGLLFYETWSGPQINQQGPSERFRLRPSELRDAFSQLKQLHVDESEGRSQLIAQANSAFLY